MSALEMVISCLVGVVNTAAIMKFWTFKYLRQNQPTKYILYTLGASTVANVIVITLIM